MVASSAYDSFFRKIILMNILITGGAGFIGSNLAAYHLEKGDSVFVVDNMSSGSVANIAMFFKNPSFQFEEANILDWAGLKAHVRWADRIYHLAAIVGVKKVLEDPRAVMAINIAGTERVFGAVASVKPICQVVVASSSEVYGFNTNTVFAENDDVVLRSAGRLRWCYAITKLTDEYVAYAFMKKSGIPVVIVRLFNTIGPSQTGKYGMVVPNFVHQAVHNLPVTVFSDGTQTRSFCDVRDTVVYLDLLASNPLANGEIVNVGNNYEISILNLARLVIQRAKSKSEITFMTYQHAYGLEFEDISHRCPDLRKLNKLSQYQAKWSLEKTLDSLIKAQK
jgi:UDP-glucose 4-epimerase